MEFICLPVLFIAAGRKADAQKLITEFSERTFCCFNRGAI